MNYHRGGVGISDEEIVKDAERLERAAYWADVKGIAKEALELKTADEQDCFIRESVDGSERILYPNKCLSVLRFTESDDAYVDAIGDTQFVKEGASTVYQRIAYYAMLQDVTDALGELKSGKPIYEKPSW